MKKSTYIKFLVGVSLVTGAILLMSWRKKAANAAVDFLDIEEVGNNQGWGNKVFQDMMKSLGWRSGEAWCMYLAKAVYMQAFPNRADKIDKVLTGSTQGSFAAAKNSDIFKVITEGKPKPGDIVIWQSIKNSTLGHAGIVERPISGEDMYETVEGNSSFDGARDGQGVVKGKRKLVVGNVEGTLKVLGFIRMKLF